MRHGLKLIRARGVRQLFQRAQEFLARGLSRHGACQAKSQPKRPQKASKHEQLSQKPIQIKMLKKSGKRFRRKKYSI